MFVCIEGIDGCGKSTQAALLTKYLSAKFFKFPNKDSPTGELIYQHLEGKWTSIVSPTAPGAGTSFERSQPEFQQRMNQLNGLVFQSLQVANRMELAVEISKLKNKNVVLDRYWPSGYAYGKADGIDGQYLINLHEYLPQPDLFLLLDVDTRDSSERRPERRDRYEKDPSFMEKVISNYRSLWQLMAQSQPSKWLVINARKSKEETTSAINQAIAEWRLRNAEA